MKRIVVIGPAGVGKTTLAFNMAAKLDLPVTELDDLYWRPDWQAAPEEEFKQSVRHAMEPEQWLITGNYPDIREELWDRADTLVWMDYSFTTNMWRLSKRTLKNLFSDETICNGNRESLRNIFSNNSLISWFLQTYSERKREYDEIFKDPQAYPHLEKIRLTSQNQTDSFLGKLQPPGE